MGRLCCDRTHLQDLIESTALTHYEGFRSKQVSARWPSMAKGHHSDSTVHDLLQLTALKESSAKQQQAAQAPRE